MCYCQCCWYLWLALSLKKLMSRLPMSYNVFWRLWLLEQTCRTNFIFYIYLSKWTDHSIISEKVLPFYFLAVSEHHYQWNSFLASFSSTSWCFTYISSHMHMVWLNSFHMFSDDCNPFSTTPPPPLFVISFFFMCVILFLVSAGFSYLALSTTAAFMQHLILYFWNRFEVSCNHISSVQTKSKYFSNYFPTWVWVHLIFFLSVFTHILLEMVIRSLLEL